MTPRIRIRAGSAGVVDPAPGGCRCSPRGYDMRIQVRKVNSGVCEFNRIMTGRTGGIDDTLSSKMFEVFSGEIAVVFRCAVNVAGLALRTNGNAARVPIRRLGQARLRRIVLHLRKRLRPRSAVAAYFRACFCCRIERSRSCFRIIHGVEDDIDSPVQMLIARPVMTGRACDTIESQMRGMFPGDIRIRGTGRRYAMAGAATW